MSLAETIRRPRGSLLTLHNAKTPMGEAFGYLTAIMYLAPHKLSGFNVCASASEDCSRDCLFSAGRGKLPSTYAARMARTHRYFEDRPGFMFQLYHEITSLDAEARRMGLRLAVRLNGTSDIPWERVRFSLGGAPFPSIMAAHSGVTFYDYTKHRNRYVTPKNYVLTQSADRHTLLVALEALAMGRNVAAVVAGRDFDALIERPGFHDASAHDARFLDPTPSVGLLKAKGSLRKHTYATSTMVLERSEALALAEATLRARHEAA